MTTSISFRIPRITSFSRRPYSIAYSTADCKRFLKDFSIFSSTHGRSETNASKNAPAKGSYRRRDFFSIRENDFRYIFLRKPSYYFRITRLKKTKKPWWKSTVVFAEFITLRRRRRVLRPQASCVPSDGAFRRRYSIPDCRQLVHIVPLQLNGRMNVPL